MFFAMKIINLFTNSITIFFGVLPVDSYADVYMEDVGSFRTIEPVLNFVDYLISPRDV